MAQTSDERLRDARSEILTGQLTHALRAYQLVRAAALLDVAAAWTTGAERAALEALSRVTLNYHAYLQEFPVQLRAPALLLGVESLQGGASTAVGDAVTRVIRRFDVSLRSQGGVALALFLRGYYGLVQLDGFRSAYWLRKSLGTAALISRLPRSVEAVANDLDAMVVAVCKFPAEGTPRGRDLYVCAQVVSDHLGAMLKLPNGAMDELDRFALVLPPWVLL
jgi:hypothetical protein